MEEKHCKSCGRRFAWRRKWAANWESVSYCSTACRKRRVNRLDKALEAAILTRLRAVNAGASICPSEVAQAECGDSWRSEMETVRRAARRLANAGAIVITQKGKIVDPSDVRGPIRIRLVS
ncbi:MAG: DUF3253 domain-containing protein [Myxococcota bacterium]|nr:DUF3253 domain-containing protein [Myxococcota bacterium]